MFDSFFKSKNKKLVEQWSQEHREIVALAQKVIDTYENGDMATVKKYLKEIDTLAISHVMDEDLKLFNLMHEENQAIDKETQHSVKEFIKSFKKTKIALIEFLDKYQAPDEVLDIRFIATFKGLVEVLAKRIQFEEKNLYSKLQDI